MNCTKCGLPIQPGQQDTSTTAVQHILCPSEDGPNLHREYCAVMLDHMNCAGRSIPVRWQCLREDLKAEYLGRVDQIVADWWGGEETARQSRDARNPLAFFERH